MILTRDGKEITAIYRRDGSEIEEVKDSNGRIVYSASREITGTLPLSFYSLGKPLTDYLIYGNAMQDGTPSPDNIVMPDFCGDRTKNICELGTTRTFRGVTFTVINDGTVTISGRITSADESISVRVSVPIYGDGDYIFSGCPEGGSNDTYYAYMWDYTTGERCKRWDGTTPVYNETGLGQQVKIISGHEVGYGIRVTAGVTYENLVFKPMIRLHNATANFEPYGYKLSLTVNGTEYPIYLGEVPTTRRIKKLVLTGEENFGLYNISETDPSFARFSKIFQFGSITSQTAILYASTHFPGKKMYATSSSTAENCFEMRFQSGATIMVIATNAATDATSFNQWLADQYAAGHPVTVWYILADPETGIVNEPLHKIGDYADTISFAQAGVTIPTVNGANVLDMTSPVKPSEVYIKGKGIKQNGG